MFILSMLSSEGGKYENATLFKATFFQIILFHLTLFQATALV